MSTGIEWVLNPDNKTRGITWNPITGCLNGCDYCYARRLANGRLKPLYLSNDDECLNAEFNNPFAPRFWFSRLGQPKILKKARGIFVCDMGDLFGGWLKNYQCDFWQKAVFRIIKECPQHRFYLLTKQAQNLPQFSPFPNNCWVGVTATDMLTYQAARNILPDIEARIKYISFEPLLRQTIMSDTAYLTPLSQNFCNWTICGAMTGTKNQLIELNKKYPELLLLHYGNRWTLQPRIEWVREIETSARKAGIAIFEKDNLKPLLKRELIQELP